MRPSACQTLRKRSQSPESRQMIQFSITSRIAAMCGANSLIFCSLPLQYAHQIKRPAVFTEQSQPRSPTEAIVNSPSHARKLIKSKVIMIDEQQNSVRSQQTGELSADGREQFVRLRRNVIQRVRHNDQIEQAFG